MFLLAMASNLVAMVSNLRACCFSPDFLLTYPGKRPLRGDGGDEGGDGDDIGA